MNQLTQHNHLLRRFPAFELSYETVSHKKVSVSGDQVAVAIAVGRKYFLWSTYAEGSCEDAVYLLGLDKDKRIVSVDRLSAASAAIKGRGYELGTVIYGTMCDVGTQASSVGTPASSVGTPASSVENPPYSVENRVFLAEDIYQHKGTNLGNLCFGDRLGFLGEFIREVCPQAKDLGTMIALPLMWFSKSGSELAAALPSDLAKTIGYAVHHIQYRSVDKVAPYINVPLQKRAGVGPPALAVSSAQVAQKMTAATILQPLPRFDYSKPAFKYPAVFSVMADSQLDLYHLYAYGGGSGPVVYCGLAGIQSLRTSVFMNGIFRRIRENENLDLAEESEDEADFENTDLNKYVDLEKIALVECVFSQKHKKWIPVRLADAGEKMVHIEKLVSVGSGGCGREFDQRRGEINTRPINGRKFGGRNNR